MSEQEIWKDVIGYEGQYQVSNKGNVRSLDRIDNIGRKQRGRTLKPSNNKDGYLHVGLSKNGTSKHKLIHRLVAEAFIPNPNNYPEINHIDEDKVNNNVKNIEWCTREYNLNFGTARKRGSSKTCIPVKGVHKETGKEIYLKSMAEGTLHGFTPKGISDVCSGKCNTHRGYFFQKIESGEIVTFSSTVEARNNCYASKKIPKKVKAINIETGEVLRFNSAKEAIDKGYDRGTIGKACRGVYFGGNLYRGHRWSYE